MTLTTGENVPRRRALSRLILRMAEAAALMFKLADDYDKLADRAEQRAKRPPKKATPSGDQQPGVWSRPIAPRLYSAAV
jgi:hypothetical protein